MIIFEHSPRFRVLWAVVAAALAASLVIMGYFSWRAGALLLIAILGGAMLYLLYLLRTMTLEQRKVLLELSGQRVRLSAIHKVAEALSEAVELPKLLGQSLERTVYALGLDWGHIHLISDDEEQILRLSAVFGNDPDFGVDEYTIEIGECICGQAAAGGSPVVVDDLANDPRVTGRGCAAGCLRPVERGGAPSVASVPLKAKGGSLGVLTVRSCDPHHFAIHDVELLTTTANFLAAAIENARIRSEMRDRIAKLSSEVQQLAIVQERERIGREMHDGLAQTLGLLNLQIEVVKGAAKARDWAAAEGELAQLDAYLNHAYAEVREALSNLRHTAPQGVALVDTLGEHLEQFGRRNQLKVSLVVNNGENPVYLPPLVEVHLQRVIQEALTNVRRHAAANRVQVAISQSSKGWQVIVADDGVGFDMTNGNLGRSGNYGLLTMRERVESLGGTFTIESEPGSGTNIAIFVPCENDRKG